MNGLYASKHMKQAEIDLSAYQFLITILADSYSSFLVWVGFQRLEFEPDIEQEVIDYINGDLGKRRRMFSVNVDEWKKITAVVFSRDQYTCHYCGEAGGRLECDHRIPFSKGGSDELDNLTTACRKCNRQKRDKTDSEFKNWLAR